MSVINASIIYKGKVYNANHHYDMFHISIRRAAQYLQNLEKKHTSEARTINQIISQSGVFSERKSHGISVISDKTASKFLKLVGARKVTSGVGEDPDVIIDIDEKVFLCTDEIYTDFRYSSPKNWRYIKST